MIILCMTIRVEKDHDTKFTRDYLEKRKIEDYIPHTKIVVIMRN